MDEEKAGGADGQEDVSMSAAHWANIIHPDAESKKLEQKPDSVGEVPKAMEGTLAAVAASFIYSASGMSSWGLTEATLGLYKLYCRHVREGGIDTINGTLVTSTTELQEIAHWLRWAEASYHEKTTPCAQELEIAEDCIVKLLPKSAIGRPAYLIGIDHSMKAVVLSVRGTFSALDVLTDLQPHSERFENGSAHSGMLNSAKWIRDNAADELKDLMAKNGYRLVVTGHSLGAGTATLLTMLLREANDKGVTILGSESEKITCWGYCCPPCVDKKLAEETTFIRCVTHQDDIVARISPAALEDLRTEIIQTNWGQALDDGAQKKMVEMAKNSAALIHRIEPVLNLEKGALVEQFKQKGFTAVKGWTDNFSLWNKKAGPADETKSKSAASWFAAGAAAANAAVSIAGKQVVTSMNQAVNEQMKVIEQDSGKDAAAAASSVAVTAKTTMEKASNEQEGRQILEKNRLFVPGILYHVIRKPLQPGEKSPDQVSDGTGTSKGPEKDKGSYKYMVVRGDDPSSRFARIVLSPGFISDHLSTGLKESLGNAMKWLHSGEHIAASKA